MTARDFFFYEEKKFRRLEDGKSGRFEDSKIGRRIVTAALRPTSHYAQRSVTPEAN